MILTHKAKRCNLAYTTTQQILSQTPLPHEPNTDYIYTLTLNISIALCSKDLQPFLCRRLNGTQRKDGASKTSPTCYTPRLHCHTQTHTRGHRRCIPLKLSGIAPSQCINREDSLWKTQTPFCPRITIWMHGNLHHYTQLSEHRDSYSHTKAWSWILMLLKKTCTDTLHLGRSTPHFWSDRQLGAWAHLIEPEFHQDLEDLSMPRPLCLSVLLICFCLKWESLFRWTREAGGRQFWCVSR